jgi:thioredoxin reductase (NADPH)
MSVLGTSSADRTTLAHRVEDRSHRVVVALCAAWCTTCREFSLVFEAVSQSRPHATLVWVDIEDDAALVGDLDVDTFPTLAIFEGETLRHYGPVLPQAALVERMVDEPGALIAAGAPDEVVTLVARLRSP